MGFCSRIVGTGILAYESNPPDVSRAREIITTCPDLPGAENPGH
jgi:hypothetical protein